jgi:hypothetical protein
VLLFLPSSWEGKEAGSISPATLDLGDGIWARSDLGPPAQRPAWQAVVLVQGRSGWGWKQAECRVVVRTSRGMFTAATKIPLSTSDPYSRSIFFPFLTLSLEDSLYVHATSLQRGHGSGAENKLGPGRCLDFSFEFPDDGYQQWHCFLLVFFGEYIVGDRKQLAKQVKAACIEYVESWGKRLAGIAEPGQTNLDALVAVGLDGRGFLVSIS